MTLCYIYIAILPNLEEDSMFWIHLSDFTHYSNKLLNACYFKFM